MAFFCISKEKKYNDVKLKKNKNKNPIYLLPDNFAHVKNRNDNIIIDDDYHESFLCVLKHIYRVRIVPRLASTRPDFWSRGVLWPLTFSNLTVSTMRDNSETKKSLHCKFYSNYMCTLISNFEIVFRPGFPKNKSLRYQPLVPQKVVKCLISGD